MWMFILGLRFYCFLFYLSYIIIILYILITLIMYLSCLGYWYYNNTVHSSSVTNTHKHQPTLWHAVWLAVPTCLSSIYIVLLSPDNCNCLSIVVAQCTEWTVLYTPTVWLNPSLRYSQSTSCRCTWLHFTLLRFDNLWLVNAWVRLSDYKLSFNPVKTASSSVEVAAEFTAWYHLHVIISVTGDVLLRCSGIHLFNNKAFVSVGLSTSEAVCPINITNLFLC